MRKKSGFIPMAIGIEQAIVLVPEFEKVVCKLEQQVTLDGTEFLRRFVQHNLSRESGFYPAGLSKSGGSVFTTTPPNEIFL
jgi:hypothetical protein